MWFLSTETPLRSSIDPTLGDNLDALDRVLNDPAHVVEFTLDPGNILFADNQVTMHNRRGFVDAAEPEARRCLVRLWLAGQPISV